MGLGYKCLRREYIMQGVEQSLKRLQIDFHRPLPVALGRRQDSVRRDARGVLTPVAAGQGEGHRRVQLERATPGASPGGQQGARLSALRDAATAYNLYDRDSFEGELQERCVREQLGVITYFSLAAGFLTGKYRKEADFAKSDAGTGHAEVPSIPAGCASWMRSTQSPNGFHAKPAVPRRPWRGFARRAGRHRAHCQRDLLAQTERADRSDADSISTPSLAPLECG
jgi:hypothetical protein